MPPPNDGSRLAADLRPYVAGGRPAAGSLLHQRAYSLGWDKQMDGERHKK